MPRLTASDYHLNLDGQPYFLRAGELHYFRIKADLWPGALQQLKKAGFNAIASYIPWVWHEAQEGELDFDGTSDPRRNLRGFLELLREFEMPFMARPGPFIYAEYNGLGHPLWLGAGYPETVMRGPDDKIIRGDFWYGHCMGDETYRAKVKGWIEATVGVLKPYLDNVVVAYQIDNEPGFMQQNGLGQWDFNPATVRAYAAWLMQKHGSLDAISKAHHHKYGKAEALAPFKKGGTLGQAHDWQAFYEGYVVEYLRWLRGVAETVGVNVPITVNTSLTYHSPCDPHAQAAIGDYQGYDIYLKQTGGDHTADFPWGSSTYPAIVKPEVAPDKPLLSFELGTGWFDPRSTLSDGVILQSYLASLAHGLKGSVLYTVMDGVETDDSLYRYQGVLDANGDSGPRYNLVTKIQQFIQQNEADLLSASEMYDPIGYPMYQPNLRFTPDEYLPAVGLQHPVQYLSNFHGQYGPLALLLNAGYNPRPLNLQTVSDEELRRQRVIFLPSKGYADRSDYAKLLRYVKAGGHLVTFPQPLRYDLQGNGLHSGELYPEVVSKQSWLGLSQAMAAVTQKWMIGYNRQRARLHEPHPTSGHIMDAFEPLLVMVNTALPSAKLDSKFGGQVRGDYYVGVQDGRAEPLLKRGKDTVAYTAKVGDGSSTVIGTVLAGHYMTAQYYKSKPEERQQLRSFMQQLLASLGVGSQQTTELDIEVVCHNLAGGALIFLINHLPDRQQGRVRLARPDIYRTARGEVTTLFTHFGSSAELASNTDSGVELTVDLAGDDCLVVKIQ